MLGKMAGYVFASNPTLQIYAAQSGLRVRLFLGLISRIGIPNCATYRGALNPQSLAVAIVSGTSDHVSPLTTRTTRRARISMFICNFGLITRVAQLPNVLS